LTGLSPPGGLSHAEAARRLAADGYNELPAARSRNAARVAFDVVREPMFLLLVSCALLYLILGDLREAWLLVAFVGVVLGITIVQERRTERALEALRDLSSPRALVIRDGRHERIPGREVVRGDLLLLGEGDRVPADALVLETSVLAADESLLTGESVPVQKTAATAEASRSAAAHADTRRAEDGHADRAIADATSRVYAGSLIVQGQALVRAEAIGLATELGKIGRSLTTIEPGRTRLQRDTDRLVKRVSIAALALCALGVVVFGVTRGDWLGGLLNGIAIAMSLLPEEFSVVLAVFLALGAWRMSRQRVLTRRLPAIEALGAASVLCVDKTGTLTENRMRVARLVTADGKMLPLGTGSETLPEEFHTLVEFAQLATRPDPLDPMEHAIGTLSAATLAGTEHVHGDWRLVREYPLRPELLAMAQVWRRVTPSSGADVHAIAAKGAPEAIVDLCHLPEAERARIAADVATLAADAYRVLAVAAADAPAAPLPAHQHDFAFRYLGLVALADPLRASVPGAIAEWHRAGNRVVMITGDLPATASAIAREAGLADPERVLTGAELERMSKAELEQALATTHVIARAVPAQKLAIVRALQARGDVVAMTGDGVNDAPALKAADIGVAMGKRGADVAREAAALVIVDDDFASIVRAVKMGRRIYTNLRKAVSYIIAVHLPIAGLALVPIFGGTPVVLMPVHIAFLELIIDPACSIAFEAEPAEADTMRRPPRPRDASLYAGRAVWFGVLEGAAVLAFVLAVYFTGVALALPLAELRSVSFLTLVLGNLALILGSRSHARSALAALTDRNPAVWWIVGGTCSALALVFTLPFARTLFDLAPLTPPLFATGAGVFVAVIVTLFLARFAVYGRARSIR
jgi:Ca2+-transporting ATPase